MDDKKIELKSLCKFKINETDFDDYKYNVQLLVSINGGKDFYYGGTGRFCKTKKEVSEYIDLYKKNHLDVCFVEDVNI